MKEGIKKTFFEPYVIQSLLKIPKDKTRSMPFRHIFPASYHEEVIINLPDEWNATPSSSTISCNNFIFKVKYEYYYKKIVLEYDFDSIKDHVLPEETEKFFASIKEQSNDWGYELSVNDNSKPTQTPFKNILYSVLGVFVVAGGLVWWSQRS